MRWSPSAAEQQFIREQVQARVAARDIAAALNVDPARVQNWCARNGVKRGAVERAAPVVRDIHDILDIPPRPFAVPVAKATPPKKAQPIRAVVIGDLQVPYHDPEAVGIAESIITDVGPDILLHLGDQNDAYDLSDYDRDPARKESLQDEIDQSRAILHRFAQLAPKARRVLLEGNHEDRLRRTIWKMPGASSALARLKLFQQTMTWPSFLGLEEIGWEWIPTDRQSRTEVLPKLVSIHGHQLSRGTVVESGMARKGIQKYGRSVIMGHGHRACVVTRRDHNGQSFGIEGGCLCMLDGQPYGVDFNWGQAITVIEWTLDRRLMHVDQILLREGRALWRGREWAA